MHRPSCHDQPSLRQGGEASFLADGAADEVAPLGELVMDGGMDRSELLAGLHAAEASDLPRSTTPLQRFLREFQRGRLVPGFGRLGFQHVILVVDGAPEITPLAIHLHERLVHYHTVSWLRSIQHSNGSSSTRVGATEEIGRT